ncbi:MAG: hypothetical protein JNM25_04025 [Planctomycetes bacterium]|nr:hypothetical protein [Planctomycetota bacterium]
MDISTSTIVAGFLVSTVGFSVFLYGKKQARLPQLVTGGLLLLLPFVLQDALWMSVVGAASVAGLWLCVRAGA